METQEFTDVTTGTHLTVEYDIPDNPRINVVFPAERTLSIEQCNEALTELLGRADIPAAPYLLRLVMRVE